MATKIITVPDLHGKNYWKTINPDKFDKIIFSGDYTDSKNQVSTAQEIINLKEIIQFKFQHPQKVVLLLGNHDIQYLHYPLFSSAHLNYEAQEAFTSLFLLNRNAFQVAFQESNHLWTHAGVSNKWFNQYIKNRMNPAEYEQDLASFLNDLHNRHPEVTVTIGPARKGHAHYGGIFWADKSETENDYLTGYHQYVGHTKVFEIEKRGNQNSSIHYLDCLNNKIEFLTAVIEV